MLADIVEIKNIFDNPDEIVNVALRQNYILRKHHYQNVHGGSYYEGVRSMNLFDISQDLYRKINNEIFNKMFQKSFGDLDFVQFGFDFETSCYFHILREQDQFKDFWRHKDDNCLYAGVIYLSKNPRPNTGTIIYKDGKEIVIDNEYNKLILYKPSFEHSAQGGFGTDINDSRLTLTMFVNAISFRAKAAFTEEEKKAISGINCVPEQSKAE